MDVRTAESRSASKRESWLQRERVSGRFYDRIALLVAVFLIVMIGVSAWVLDRGAAPGTLLSPPLIALLLIATLLPAIPLMALYARRLALQRAERGGLGSGRLHIRLVVLFTAIAAVPTVLVAIFASLLFQSGLEFWFSNRARNMLENTVQVAQTTYKLELDRVGNESVAMAGDLTGYLQKVPLDDPQFQTGLFFQTYQRSMNEAAIVRIGRAQDVQTLAVASGNYGVSLNDERIKKAVAALQKLPGNASVDVKTPSRVAVLTRLGNLPNTYLYVGRVDPDVSNQISRSNEVLRDYRSLLNKSHINQLRFNAALLLGALIIVGLSILTALRLADRLVRPVGELVSAAGRIEDGDFSTRVPVSKTEDEVQTLALAFNQMTGRLEQQTTELKTANTQAETRRGGSRQAISPRAFRFRAPRTRSRRSPWRSIR
jgi:two-component system nitrogen regulation sensor histidine kinase NtrY